MAATLSGFFSPKPAALDNAGTGSPNGADSSSHKPLSVNDIAEGDDILTSATFTYPWLKNVVTLGPGRPKTIHIPQKALDSMTGMERQFWDIKRTHFDIVVFFKKGKFYELYDCDAVVANREFGLKMAGDTGNRGKMRMCGVPEQSFAEWSRLFIFRGYKVGRVEQMVQDEQSANDPKVKLVPRELVQILTRGTTTDGAMLSGTDTNFVLSIVPVVSSPTQTPPHPRTPNIADDEGADAIAIDLSRGVYFQCPFQTLLHCTALLHQLAPVEVILPSEQCDASVFSALIESVLPDAHIEYISSTAAPPKNSKEIFHCERSASESSAWKQLALYLGSLKLDVARLLPSLASTANSDEDAELTSDSYKTKFHLYHAHICSEHLKKVSPLSLTTTSILARERRSTGMVLDAAAMESLELTANLRDGTKSGTLASTLATHAQTPGGTRLLHQWVLRPASDPKVIVARQQLVAMLRAGGPLHKAWNECFAGASLKSDAAGANNKPTTLRTADFERLLARMSDLAHEDPRVAYADPLVLYPKHFSTLDSTLGAYQKLGKLAVTINENFTGLRAEAKQRQDNDEQDLGFQLLEELLKPILACTQPIAKLIEQYQFNAKTLTKNNNMVIPSTGMFPKYDEACATIKNHEEELNNRLTVLKEKIDRNCSYCDLGKELFLVEVPEGKAKDIEKLGFPKGEFKERARTNKVIKYSVTSSQALIAEYKDATTTKENSLVGVLRVMAMQLVKEAWTTLFLAAQSLAYLDCLAALASVADEQQIKNSVCFPKFILSLESSQERAENHNVRKIECKGAYHPTVLSQSGAVVKNDLHLAAAAGGRILLLTGPNMSGKSTTMRTLAAAIILAQMGGCACADSMIIEGNTVDRIFTRIGARDATHRGFSTLRVELEEMASIHRAATGRSLCLVDELGRGTSTHDGFAIAHSSLRALSSCQDASPLTIFSTHYHSLALEFSTATGHNVQLGYMDYKLVPLSSNASDENNNAKKRQRPTDENDQGGEAMTVKFLYRLVSGICARSYGVEVAAKAGLPPAVVNNARQNSFRMQQAATDIQLLHCIKAISSGSPSEGIIAKAKELVELAKQAPV